MRKVFSIIVVLILAGCASNDAYQTQFPIPISDYFYEIKGSQTHFVIEFEEPIPEGILLGSLYFRGQTAAIKMISNQKAEAAFTTPDFVLEARTEKEFGNQPPILQKQRFQLSATEAVVEFSQNKKINHYKFNKVTEKSNK